MNNINIINNNLVEENNLKNENLVFIKKEYKFAIKHHYQNQKQIKIMKLNLKNIAQCLIKKNQKKRY